MCTVTFIPTGNNHFALTSNRDEAPDRDTIPPKVHVSNDTRMLFPKDALAGGTWIGVSDKHRLVCVLNGGFSLHQRQPKYRLSRGVIAKEFLETENLLGKINTCDLHDIEPFTMVIVDWNLELGLFELVWDGNEKHFSQLPLEPRLWSSSTLYSEHMKEKRQNWFMDYLDKEDPSSESILKFHESAGKGNLDYGVVMDRGFVKTTSRTQIEKTDSKIQMTYHDLKTNDIFKMNLETSIVANE